MEALTISAANLNTIENNLGEVAKELNGVISNVNYMNDQVSGMENKVESLNSEIQNMMQEIRENTILTNARQNIMYNNQEIEKKFGYYDNVRRTTISMLDAIKYSTVSTNGLKKLREDILLNNPNYWLTNALAAVSSWILDDKENTYKELNNALRINEEKTSLFLTLINLKLNRTQTSINWLNKYLSLQNPIDLDRDFISILDLVSSGVFGDEQKRITLDKIINWQKDLNSNKKIINKQLDTWCNYIIEAERTNINFHNLPKATDDYETILDNLLITSSYKEVQSKLETIITTATSNKKIDEILNNLIYEYEDAEQIYQDDNLKNNLIIECNGDKQKAQYLYDKQKDIYNTKQDINSLLTNIVIYPDKYKISNETQKIALALVKQHIISAFNEMNKMVKYEDIDIQVGDFKTTTKDGQNYKDVVKEIDTFLEHTYTDIDKNPMYLLIFIDIVGLLSIILTIKFPILTLLIVLILIGANYLIIDTITKKIKARKEEKQRAKDILCVAIEKVFAEITDYSNVISEHKNDYEKLVTYLNNLNPEDYIKNNEERNIIV